MFSAISVPTSSPAAHFSTQGEVPSGSPFSLLPCWGKVYNKPLRAQASDNPLSALLAFREHLTLTHPALKPDRYLASLSSPPSEFLLPSFLCRPSRPVLSQGVLRSLRILSQAPYFVLCTCSLNPPNCSKCHLCNYDFICTSLLGPISKHEASVLPAP